MKSVLLFAKTCFVKKTCSAIQFLQILSLSRPFSAYKLIPREENRRLANALRVIDLINPKTSDTENRRTHLRLIEDIILPTNINQPFDNDYARSNTTAEITKVFDEMLRSSALHKENWVSSSPHLHRGGLRVDVRFLSQAVSSCGSKRDLWSGVQYHCLAIITGFVANVYVGSSLISLYSNCTLVDNAYRVFEEMPVRNVVSWTAIIAGFAQEWQIDVCLELFHGMRSLALKPNDFTYTSLLSACTGSGALGHGRSAHCQVIHMGFHSYIHISNALIAMYCKCGSIQDAFYMFKKMDSKDVVSWNSMIAGYAQHGLAVEAINLFEEMKRQCVKPDAITYLGILSSCRHAGLVEEGRLYFSSMVQHGLQPEIDHYSCIVDLLGRAGLVQEARVFVENMPVIPNSIIWGSLLSSSRLHGSVLIGIQAAESRLLLEPSCTATLIQLANLYASVGRWDQVARVRKLMKDKGLKTNPGCSWIELKNVLHKFGAEDRGNASMTESLLLMDSLIDHMTSIGYQPGVLDEEIEDA